MANESKTPARKIIDTAGVLAVLGISRSTLHVALLKKLDFPRPFKIGLRKNAWYLADVEAWIAARIETGATA